MKKVKLSQDKKFLFSSMLKILLIQIIFLLFAVFVVRGDSGTYVQFPIFYGWLILPISYLKYFASSSDTVSFWLIVYFLLIPIIFLLSSSFFVKLTWKYQIRKKVLIFVLVFHFIGALVCILTSKHESWLFYPNNISQYIWIFSVCIAIFISFFFWRIFFQIVDYKSKINKQ